MFVDCVVMFLFALSNAGIKDVPNRECAYFHDHLNKKINTTMYDMHTFMCRINSKDTYISTYQKKKNKQIYTKQILIYMPDLTSTVLSMI